MCTDYCLFSPLSLSAQSRIEETGSEVTLGCGPGERIEKQTPLNDNSLGQFEPVPTDQARFILNLTTGVLTIRNLGPSDEGVYQCSLTNLTYCVFVISKLLVLTISQYACNK